MEQVKRHGTYVKIRGADGNPMRSTRRAPAGSSDRPCLRITALALVIVDFPHALSNDWQEI